MRATTQKNDPTTTIFKTTMISMAKAPWIVKSLADVSRFFRVARSTIGEWRQAGAPGTKGAWDLSELYHWKTNRQRDPTAVDAANELVADAARRKKIADAKTSEARARKLEIENSVAVGEMVYHDEVQQSAAEMVLRIKNRLEACPDDFMMSFPRDTREQNTSDFQNFISHLLKELSSWEPIKGEHVETMICDEADKIREKRAAGNGRTPKKKQEPVTK